MIGSQFVTDDLGHINDICPLNKEAFGMRRLGKSEFREISKSYICRDMGNMLTVSVLL